MEVNRETKRILM